MLRLALARYRYSPFGFLLASGFVLSGYSQNAQPPGDAVLTLRSTARTVIVDVVVTKGGRFNGKGSEPVTGLHKEDFQIFEQGEPQTLTYFEEHPLAPTVAPKPRTPTPNVFVNTQDVGTTDAVNVILLDSINTPIQDQAFVHTQIVKYIKGMPPGKPVALFSLAIGGLTYLHGFTTNPSELLANLSGDHPRSGPQFSPLLHTGEDAQEQQMTALMEQAQADRAAAGLPGSPGLQAMIDQMQQFQAQQRAFEGQERTDATLDAMRQIARYLTGIPGRKNVIWFSSSFPLNVLPTPETKLDAFAGSEQHEEEVQQTTQLLSAAQVALYPVAAEGADNVGGAQAGDLPGTYQSLQAAAANSAAPITGLYAPSQIAVGATDSQIGPRQTAVDTRNQAHATMDLVAEQTGGEAFYNNNAVGAALAHVLNDGTYYYRLAYTPTDRGQHEGYRNIEVKLREGNYHLAYRRNYLVESPKKEAAKITRDPLAPMMKPGMPDFSQIVFKALMQRTPAPADTGLAGQNANLKQPLQRFTAHFSVSMRDLGFELTPDGVHRANLEVGLVAYDLQGHAVNWLSKEYDLNLMPDEYSQFVRYGLQLQENIDVPTDKAFLRCGIFDLNSKRAGTLQIPLQAVEVSSTQ
jgi:VWFA-related protein